MLAYVLPADSTNKYIEIGESTTIERLERFFMLLSRFFQAAILDHLTPMMLQRLKLVNKDSRYVG